VETLEKEPVFRSPGDIGGNHAMKKKGCRRRKERKKKRSLRIFFPKERGKSPQQKRGAQMGNKEDPFQGRERVLTFIRRGERENRLIAPEGEKGFVNPSSFFGWCGMGRSPREGRRCFRSVGFRAGVLSGGGRRF